MGKAVSTDLSEWVEKDWVELLAYLQKFISHQKPSRQKALEEMFKAVLKLAHESPGTLNLKIASTVLRELRYSFKMFYPHRMKPKITIFGSARVAPNTKLYRFTKDFAQEAISRNFQIITGGGPGIMAAGNEGAGKDGFGLNIRLPMEQSANPFIDPENRLIHYKYFFTRKLFLVKEACAFAFFPGGFGTFDEAFEVLTLLQTGKSSLFPILLVEPAKFGFWTRFMKFFDDVIVEQGFVSASDRSLFAIFHTAKEAMDHIQLFYNNYHSMRYVGEILVVRIQRPLPEKMLKDLSRKFKKLTGGKPIQQHGPLEEEKNEPEFGHLMRLTFPFIKNDYGTLRLLVDEINRV